MLETLRYRLEAAALQCCEGVVRRLPERWWWPLGRALGGAGFRLFPGRRRVALGNVRACLPALSEAEAREVALESFRRLAWTFLEILGGALSPRAEPLRRVELLGLDDLEAAVKEGRGVVLVAPHLGNWELLGAVTAQLGFGPLTVSKRLKNPYVSEWMRRRREEAGVEVLWAEKASSMALLERLEQRGIIAMVTDQDARSRGVEVQYLGRTASAHRGAAMLALAADSPIVLCSIVRTGDGRRHEIEYTRLRAPAPSGRLEEDVLSLTQAYTDRLGERVLKHPADYLWAHNRFKNR